MIKRFFAAILVSLLLVTPVLAVPQASEVTESQLGQIGQNCTEVQVNLRNIQKNDTVLRINLGRLYDLTLRQTGAFTARLTLHQIDAENTKQQVTELRNNFNNFINDYDTYAESLEKAISSDCQAQPREFYAALGAAEVQRKKVAVDAAAMKQHLNEYIASLQKLQADRFPLTGGSNE